MAEIDPASCTGCRQCMRACQFGALGYSAGEQRAVVDQRHCCGCGVCRAARPAGAIRLRNRADAAAVAELW